MTTIAQDALDYSNEAQIRVAADTRVLHKRRTLTLVPGVQAYTLAADVIALLAVLDGPDEIPYATPDDALQAITAPAELIWRRYYLIGDSIGIIPTPTEAGELTLYYEARPVPLTSVDPFELEGDYELLIDRLVQAMKLLDDGQPELAAEEQAFYDVELIRLRRRDARESRNRLTNPGIDG